MDALTLALLFIGAMFFALALIRRTTDVANWVAAGLLCWIATAIIARL